MKNSKARGFQQRRLWGIYKLEKSIKIYGLFKSTGEMSRLNKLALKSSDMS